jgi:hypothetical protein
MAFIFFNKYLACDDPLVVKHVALNTTNKFVFTVFTPLI